MNLTKISPFRNFSVRVAEENEREYPYTQDIVQNRINVAVVNIENKRFIKSVLWIG